MGKANYLPSTLPNFDSSLKSVSFQYTHLNIFFLPSLTDASFGHWFNHGIYSFKDLFLNDNLLPFQQIQESDSVQICLVTLDISQLNQLSQEGLPYFFAQVVSGMDRGWLTHSSVAMTIGAYPGGREGCLPVPFGGGILPDVS